MRTRRARFDLRSHREGMICAPYVDGRVKVGHVVRWVNRSRVVPSRPVMHRPRSRPADPAADGPLPGNRPDRRPGCPDAAPAHERVQIGMFRGSEQLPQGRSVGPARSRSIKRPARRLRSPLSPASRAVPAWRRIYRHALVPVRTDSTIWIRVRLRLGSCLVRMNMTDRLAHRRVAFNTKKCWDDAAK